jgi:hypothetical protein
MIRSGLASIAALAALWAQPAAAVTCDQTCLRDMAAGFVQAALQGNWQALPMSPDAEIRENALPVELGGTVWPRVTTVRSEMVFADATTGNVIVRSGVALKDGKPAYISTRLRVSPAGRIVDVEIASDTTERVVPAYVWALDPIYSQTVPEAQRNTRSALEAIVRRYFHALDTHQPVHEDFDDAVCDRFHSGARITNVANNAVEGRGSRSCITAMEGTPPWQPASEQRVPVIDVEHGVVVGITLLHYPRVPARPTMYVTEVFKIVDGRITRIDNIGLMQPTMETLGFVH